MMDIILKSVQDFIDNLLDCQNVPSVLFWIYLVLFVCSFVIATFGKRFGIRKRYIDLLDKVFFFAASRIDKKPVEETEDDYIEEEYVVISPQSPRVKMASGSPGQFSFEDSMPYITAGMRSITEDCVNSSFSPEKLQSWNILSRTKNEHDISQSKSVTLIWLAGFFVRYILLVPVRLVILAISLSTMVLCTFLVGRLPDGNFKRKLNAFVVCWSFDFVANTLSVVARFHNKKNRPAYGIAVANHTSPIDSMVLATDNCYDMVGQKTKGFLGLFMSALSKSSTHIWFERSSSNDRKEAFNRLHAHAQNRDLPPVLMFPEGICVNNTAVLLFRKGVFELNTIIYPIALKFDPRYGDPFWHEGGFFYHIFSMITSWAIVCDIWYLPPMTKQPEETPIDFASRVNCAIAETAGLKQVEWDGFVKVLENRPEQKFEKNSNWLKKQQYEFAKQLQEKPSTSTLAL